MEVNKEDKFRHLNMLLFCFQFIGLLLFPYLLCLMTLLIIWIITLYISVMRLGRPSLQALHARPFLHGCSLHVQATQVVDVWALTAGHSWPSLPSSAELALLVAWRDRGRRRGGFPHVGSRTPRWPISERIFPALVVFFLDDVALVHYFPLPFLFLFGQLDQVFEVAVDILGDLAAEDLHPHPDFAQTPRLAQ